MYLVFIDALIFTKLTLQLNSYSMLFSKAMDYLNFSEIMLNLQWMVGIHRINLGGIHPLKVMNDQSYIVEKDRCICLTGWMNVTEAIVALI